VAGTPKAGGSRRPLGESRILFDIYQLKVYNATWNIQTVAVVARRSNKRRPTARLMRQPAKAASRGGDELGKTGET
jgi:hypothetical protein